METYDTRTHKADIGDMIRLTKTQNCGKFVSGGVYRVFGWGHGMLHIESGSDKALIMDRDAVLDGESVVKREVIQEQLTFF